MIAKLWYRLMLAGMWCLAKASDEVQLYAAAAPAPSLPPLPPPLSLGPAGVAAFAELEQQYQASPLASMLAHGALFTPLRQGRA